jgi:hypothetical protein
MLAKAVAMRGSKSDNTDRNLRTGALRRPRLAGRTTQSSAAAAEKQRDAAGFALHLAIDGACDRERLGRFIAPARAHGGRFRAPTTINSGESAQASAADRRPVQRAAAIPITVLYGT